MNKIKTKKLKEELEATVSKIIKVFEKKQDLPFDGFVGDDCLDVACFGDIYFFNLQDICHDIFTDQPKDLIFDWQSDCIDNKDKYINYKSYCMGARHTQSENIK